ncbi:MAG TPA: threonine--tRNA ligase [Actinocatenispora sp.]
MSDHRRIGRDLDLFDTDPLAGPGLPLWLPDGAVIRAELERLAAESAQADGCRRIFTPVLAKRELFERSGHWDKFADDMFPAMLVGGEEYVLRPANCPHHALVYASRQRSVRDLPYRLSELGSMFRSELSGVLTGLSRVRQISLDDAHVFCAPDQVRDEIVLALRSIRRVYDLLGVEVAYFRLSRRSAEGSYLGGDELWADAEAQLADALDHCGLSYQDAPGEAAFYGPKIDVQVLDAAGREITLSTVQLDFNQPERFDLSYVGHDGARHRPVMIHRGIMSAMERLVAYLLERYDGALPLWLSPVQVVVLPVAEAHRDAADKLLDSLRDNGIRAELADPADTLGARVRRARQRRVPYQAVLGDREVASGGAAVRGRDGDRRDMDPDGLVAELRTRIADRA